MTFPGKVGNGPMNSWLNFAGDPDHRLDTGIVFRIVYYCEAGKAGPQGHHQSAKMMTPETPILKMAVTDK